jgi:hypothetical protein
MTDGYQVDLHAPDQGVAGVNGTLDEVSQQPVSAIPDDESAIGDSGLASTLSDFLNRWELGVQTLGHDRQQIAARLTANVNDYAAVEHGVAEQTNGMGTGTGPDPGEHTSDRTGPDQRSDHAGAWQSEAIASTISALDHHGDVLDLAGKGLDGIATSGGWEGAAADAFPAVRQAAPGVIRRESRITPGGQLSSTTLMGSRVVATELPGSSAPIWSRALSAWPTTR